MLHLNIIFEEIFEDLRHKLLWIENGNESSTKTALGCLGMWFAFSLALRKNNQVKRNSVYFL